MEPYGCHSNEVVLQGLRLKMPRVKQKRGVKAAYSIQHGIEVRLSHQAGKSSTLIESLICDQPTDTAQSSSQDEPWALAVAIVLEP